MALRSDDRAFLPKIGLKEADIEWIEENWDAINSGASQFYDEFQIREREKFRKICAPQPRLKKIQRILMRKFFYKFRTTEAAHGFVLGRSPVTNAEVHRKKWEEAKAGPDRDAWCLLQIDVENFFPTIPTNEVMRVIAYILQKRFDCKTVAGVCEIILSLCQKDGALPMGAPTSPAISNLVMARFDRVMMRFCKKWNLTYTRYADDITVSGAHANRAYTALSYYLGRMGLSIKAKKTRVLRPHRAMVVTGVTINSGELTVSRKYRRRLRAQIHQTKLHREGAYTPAHAALLKEPRPVPFQVLLGRAGWCASVNKRHEKFTGHVSGLLRMGESG